MADFFSFRSVLSTNIYPLYLKSEAAVALGLILTGSLHLISDIMSLVESFF